MKEVLLDTSSMLFALEHGVDIVTSIRDEFPGFVITVPYAAVAEMRKIAKTHTKNAGNARVMLLLITERKLNIDGKGTYADEWILKNAFGKVVCTNDIKLKRKLNGLKIRVVSVAVSGRIR